MLSNFLIIYSVKNDMPNGELDLSLIKIGKLIIFEIQKHKNIFFKYFKKVSDFFINFPEIFGWRSLQIRGLFFLRPKLDFI